MSIIIPPGLRCQAAGQAHGRAHGCARLGVQDAGQGIIIDSSIISSIIIV